MAEKKKTNYLMFGCGGCAALMGLYMMLVFVGAFIGKKATESDYKKPEAPENIESIFQSALQFRFGTMELPELKETDEGPPKSVGAEHVKWKFSMNEKVYSATLKKIKSGWALTQLKEQMADGDMNHLPVLVEEVSLSTKVNTGQGAILRFIRDRYNLKDKATLESYIGRDRAKNAAAYRFDADLKAETQDGKSFNKRLEVVAIKSGTEWEITKLFDSGQLLVDKKPAPPKPKPSPGKWEINRYHDPIEGTRWESFSLPPEEGALSLEVHFNPRSDYIGPKFYITLNDDRHIGSDRAVVEYRMGDKVSPVFQSWRISDNGKFLWVDQSYKSLWLKTMLENDTLIVRARDFRGEYRYGTFDLRGLSEILKKGDIAPGELPKVLDHAKKETIKWRKPKG